MKPTANALAAESSATLSQQTTATPGRDCSTLRPISAVSQPLSSTHCRRRAQRAREALVGTT